MMLLGVLVFPVLGLASLGHVAWLLWQARPDDGGGIPIPPEDRRRLLAALETRGAS